MDNHGQPEEYELPADMDSGWDVLKRAVTGIVVGICLFIGAIIWSVS
jgi:hypothetical protein